MLTYPNQEAVSTRDLAWSTAGTSTENLSDKPMTASEGLERAGLANWNVRHVPLTTSLGDHPGAFDDAGLVVPSQFATVASIEGQSKVLGVVGNRHTAFQNEEVAELMDFILGESGGHFTALGSMASHRKTFMVAKMPKGLLIGGEDASDLYLGATNFHDGGGSLSVWVTGVRLRCTNMLNSAMRGAKAKWRLRHTSGIKGRAQQARESLNLTFQWADEFERQMEKFLAEPFTGNEFDALVDRLAPPSESDHEGWRERQETKRNTLRFLFNEADTNEFGRGTKYGAYNAFTEYADWLLPVKGANADLKRAERNLDSATVDNLKQTAFDALVAA